MGVWRDSSGRRIRSQWKAWWCDWRGIRSCSSLPWPSRGRKSVGHVNRSMILMNSAVLSRTPKDVTTILKRQHDTSSKLHGITKGIAALQVSAEAYHSTADQMASILGSVQWFTEPTQRLMETHENVGSASRRLNDAQGLELLDWPSSGRRGRHREVRSRRTRHTGQWVSNTLAFQKWLDGSQKLIWIVGAPGCGKLTLAYVEIYLT